MVYCIYVNYVKNDINGLYGYIIVYIDMYFVYDNTVKLQFLKKIIF